MVLVVYREPYHDEAFKAAKKDKAKKETERFEGEARRCIINHAHGRPVTGISITAKVELPHWRDRRTFSIRQLKPLETLYDLGLAERRRQPSFEPLVNWPTRFGRQRCPTINADRRFPTYPIGGKNEYFVLLFIDLVADLKKKELLEEAVVRSGLPRAEPALAQRLVEFSRQPEPKKETPVEATESPQPPAESFPSKIVEYQQSQRAAEQATRAEEE